VEVNPALWLSAVSQYKVRDTFCSYGVMELCTKGLGSSVNQLKSRGVNLACVRTCVVVAEERPRINLTTSFSKLFSALGLSPRAVSTSFGCRVNVAICLQGASSPEPSTVYVDLRALRNDRVSLVERGSPHSLCLMESGKLLPGVKVIIANPESKGQCGDSHLGEIWVQSGHSASGYFTIYGDESEYGDHFNARWVSGGRWWCQSMSRFTDRIDKYRRMMMLVKYLSMSVRFFNLDILIKQFSTKFDCIGVFVSCSDQEF
jgi:acyl-CoA synthetase (AMP-forming)/AMP-acid ligase II